MNDRHSDFGSRLSHQEISNQRSEIFEISNLLRIQDLKSEYRISAYRPASSLQGCYQFDDNLTSSI